MARSRSRFAPTPRTRRRRERSSAARTCPRIDQCRSEATAESSIFLDALDIHDAAPAGRVTLDVVLHLLGRGWHRDVADDRKLVTNIRQLEDFADLPIEPADDGTRGAARRRAAGAARPIQDMPSKPGSVSAMAGISGSSTKRLREETARPRNMPPLIWANAIVPVSIMTSSRPPNRSCTIWVLPR